MVSLRFRFSRQATAIIAMGVLSFGLGFAADRFLQIGQNERVVLSKQLRLSGYQFINPLLACDVSDQREFTDLAPLKKKIEDVIAKNKSDKNIETAAVYFRNLSNGHWAAVNDSELFYPASLGKVPLLIAYLKLAETDGGLLDRKIRYGGGDDLNKQQEIPPSETIEPGKIYSIGELIFRMIADSDNNAAALLFGQVDRNVLRKVYGDIGVPFRDTVKIDNLNFLNVPTYALFFRILYNGTYLNREASELALQVLSKTDYKSGLMAGVKEETMVAHKFGLTSIAPEGSITKRELHDCGIVYKPGSPYLACIMTKSSAPISNIEKTIAEISRAIYQGL